MNSHIRKVKKQILWINSNFLTFNCRVSTRSSSSRKPPSLLASSHQKVYFNPKSVNCILRITDNIFYIEQIKLCENLTHCSYFSHFDFNDEEFLSKIIRISSAVSTLISSKVLWFYDSKFCSFEHTFTYYRKKISSIINRFWFGRGLCEDFYLTHFFFFLTSWGLFQKMTWADLSNEKGTDAGDMEQGL